MGKAFKFRNLSTHNNRLVFLNSYYCLKAWILFISSKPCQFSLMWQVYFFSRKCLPNTQMWKQKMCKGPFSRKNGVPWREVATLAQCLNNHTVLFLKSTSHFNIQRCFIYILYIYIYRETIYIHLYINIYIYIYIYTIYRGAHSTSHFCYINIEKIHSQRLRLNTINNYYYSARTFLVKLAFFFFFLQLLWFTVVTQSFTHQCYCIISVNLNPKRKGK